MDLPFPNSTNNPSEVPAAPAYTPPSHNRRGLWIRLGILLVVLIGIGVGLYFAFRPSNTANNSAKTGSSQTATNSTTGDTTNGGSNTSTSGTGSRSTPGTSNSQGTGNNSSATSAMGGGSAAPSAGNSGSSNQLTNTGPGQTIGLFAAASAGGAILYQVVLRRRTND